MNAGDAEDYNIPDEELNYHIIGVVLSQKLDLKAGIKKFFKPE